MTLQEILNADLSSVRRWAGQGLEWWGRELADMVPPSLRRSLARGAPWQARAETLEGPVHLWRGGRLAQTLGADGPGGGGRLVDMALPRTAVLVHDLMLPPLSGSDLRRLIELNIDRYTPFRMEQVCFDVAAAGAADDGRQRVRLGVLERSRARAALDLAAGLGLTVKRLGVIAGELDDGVAFDFLPGLRLGDAPRKAVSRKTWLWTACAGLAAANAALAVIGDMRDLGRLEQTVEAQRPLVARAAQLRRRVEAERGRRLDLLTRRSVQEPLRILDAVTRALPSGAWVQRLEWNGRSVRVAGLKPPAFDVAAALQGPALGNVRSLASDMPTKTAAGQAPFDVLADSTAQVRP